MLRRFKDPSAVCLCVVLSTNSTVIILVGRIILSLQIGFFIADFTKLITHLSFLRERNDDDDEECLLPFPRPSSSRTDAWYSCSGRRYVPCLAGRSTRCCVTQSSDSKFHRTFETRHT
jgi:hypothetical protein